MNRQAVWLPCRGRPRREGHAVRVSGDGREGETLQGGSGRPSGGVGLLMDISRR